MKGAFAGSKGRGTMFLGRSQGRGALFLGCSQGARACGIVLGAFARAQGRGALFLGHSLGQAAFAGAWGNVFGEFAGGKNRVYDFFPTDVRFFCKFEFYVHIHYYF